jgi:hypothetical protein
MPERETLRRLLAHARGSAIICGVFGLGYGALAMLFGPALWGGSPAYDTARIIPFWPRSWCGLLALFSLCILYGLYRKQMRPLRFGLAAMCTWCLFLALAFFVESAQSATSFGLSAVWLYIVLGMFSANTLVLARSIRW